MPGLRKSGIRSLGTKFYHNSIIETFDELRFFTGLTQLATDSFNGCNSLRSIVIPSNVTTIGRGCFYQCAFVNFTMPDFVTSWGVNVFISNAQLVNFTISNTVTTIPQSFCSLNPKIDRIIIPAQITEIQHYAFQDDKPRYIVFYPVTPPTLGSENALGVWNKPIYVPDASVEAYKTAQNYTKRAGYIYPLSQFHTDFPDDILPVG